jgi:colanic acid/amylovoran biosynthesis glycosyltransferase
MNTVGYILRKFPVLSETFVLEEILALEAEGVPIHIFSLARPSDPRFHENLARLKAPITYVPEITSISTLLRANKRAAKRYKRRYFQTLRYTLVRRDATLLWRFLQAGYIAMEARRRGVTHFHAHFATRATSVAFMASQISRIPYSFTAHAYDIFRSNVNLYALKRKIQKVRFVVTISDFNKSYLEGIAPDSADKIVRIYNGIDLGRFVPAGPPPAAPFTILSVARLVEKKGLPVLIEACARLQERGVDFRCWIIGKGQLRPQLQALIEQHCLQNRVRLLGAQTQGEVLEHYRSAHLFALPCIVGSNGDRDGLPVSIVEALACGLPVVSSPVTAIPEIVHHGQNGLLVPEGNADALATTLESVICDPLLYPRLQANARCSIMSMFDNTKTTAQLARLFKEVQS